MMLHASECMWVGREERTCSHGFRSFHKETLHLVEFFFASYCEPSRPVILLASADAETDLRASSTNHASADGASVHTHASSYAKGHGDGKSRANGSAYALTGDSADHGPARDSAASAKWPCLGSTRTNAKVRSTLARHT